MLCDTLYMEATHMTKQITLDCGHTVKDNKNRTLAAHEESCSKYAELCAARRTPEFNDMLASEPTDYDKFCAREERAVDNILYGPEK